MSNDDTLASKQDRIVTKSVHAQAQMEVKKLVDDFENELILQAKIFAKDDELVLTRHVKNALDTIKKREKRRSTQQELFLLVGGIFFGSFLQGFFLEISQEVLRPTWIVIYVFLGFVGLLLILSVFWRPDGH